MSDDQYAGIHGRRPGDEGHGGRDPHFAPAGWEDLDAGICPHCGRTVKWDAERERWVLDPSLTVVVLKQDDFDTIIERLTPLPLYVDETKGLRDALWLMHSLNRPFDDPDEEPEECAECGHLHWMPESRRYITCPIEGCGCPGQ